jgi:hypothetical protein
MNARFVSFVLASCLAALTGCSATTDGAEAPATSESETKAAVVLTSFSPAALGYERAQIRTSIDTRVGRKYISSMLAPWTGKVLPGQIVDLGPGPVDHLFEVRRDGMVVGEIRAKANQVTSFALRRPGRFEVACTDCETPVLDFDALPSWDAAGFDAATTGWTLGALSAKFEVLSEIVHCTTGFPSPEMQSSTCLTLPMPDLL